MNRCYQVLSPARTDVPALATQKYFCVVKAITRLMKLEGRRNLPAWFGVFTHCSPPGASFFSGRGGAEHRRGQGHFLGRRDSGDERLLAYWFNCSDRRASREDVDIGHSYI